MKNKTNERVSALLDDQLGRFEARRWTDEVVKDDQLSDRLARYQLIGSALRAELPERLSRSFSQNVMAKLDVEPAIHAQQQREWKKPMTGLAIAASVALFSVFGLNSLVAPNADPVAIGTLSGEAKKIASVLPATPEGKVAKSNNPVANPRSNSVPVTPVANNGSRPEPAVRQLSVNQPFLTNYICLLYTSPSPRDQRGARMPSSA